MLYPDLLQWICMKHLLIIDKSSDNNQENLCGQDQFSHPPQQYWNIAWIQQEPRFSRNLVLRDNFDSDTQDGYHVSSSSLISLSKTQQTCLSFSYTPFKFSLPKHTLLSLINMFLFFLFWLLYSLIWSKCMKWGKC